MKKKSEFEIPEIEVIMFSVSDEIKTGYFTVSGKWEEEDDEADSF